MNRSRMVFVGIVGLAVVVVVVGALLTTGGDTAPGSGGGVDDGNGQAPSTRPPDDAVRVMVHSSNTKETWMDQMVEQFNASGPTLQSGQAVFVDVTHVGSGSSMQAILDGEAQPVVWSPGSRTWVDQINQAWQDHYNTKLITGDCPPTIDAPLGIAMWQPMAEALGWPDKPITWEDISNLAADPQGWASRGLPEWGDFRFGHGHPAHSNSGMLSITAKVYSAVGVTEALTPADVWREAVVESMREMETAVQHYGRKDTDLLMRMTQRGPNYLHAVTTYEGNIILWNQEHADELRFPLVTIYPANGTFWVDNPYCILDKATWVSDEQEEGAALFRDFILKQESQEQLIDTGLRPAVAGIPLRAPISKEFGAVPEITRAEVPALPEPSEEVANHILDMWYQVKKPATILMVIDVSGSMEGERIKAAVDAAQTFVGLMQPNDEIIVISFHDEISELAPSGKVGEVKEMLIPRINALFAGGGTALYRVTMASIERIEAERAADIAAGEKRIYGIVLMTDGENSSDDGVTEAQMLSALPSGDESSEVRLYTIAYGEDATATDLLRTIANRTNGQFYRGSVQDIKDIYFLISSEF